MDVLARNNVTRHGSGELTFVFSHGFGCDQTMWRRVAHAFEAHGSVILFDLVGAGHSDATAYDRTRYATLHGYADDVIEICDALGIKDAVFIGHSVSATIGVLSALKRPDLIGRMVMICPSPRYANTDTYRGGFSAEDIQELLDLMDKNHLDWSAIMAPTVMGADGDKADQDDWRDSVCRTDPDIAKQFARVTFESDHRADYQKLKTETLIIGCREDALAPADVGDFVNWAVKDSTLLTLETSGHCPHVTVPLRVIDAIRRFVGDTSDVRLSAA
ncbi:alpha/beta hydrolase [Brevundimonas sp. LM2]|uniref:alpha/beta fold hydrolase n=1 Tax=Brevundimonas sp. LM2 TaxID=1938605 RepID=UPI000983BE37|nr:alpha/beta hydrolase [Brevundimonas sp. LM2]AQR63084.1 alpha/beta hydrolase [Brevundimonas sp. LM2]